ncbi:MBOAT family O-acyltransferase [Thiomicrorhabdus aquaedulcis]|uniref:MBOAT family O-acyltransferase n=1 Tax=Thiomicrorhabdus aquaedulcis TaxID=2211106 RepID=UPI000FD937EE|nr:MBOAT family O-acyltransferase [Thiomicrorhabdus aquaedulcis]
MTGLVKPVFLASSLQSLAVPLLMSAGVLVLAMWVQAHAQTNANSSTLTVWRWYKPLLVYGLFFSITLTSLFGLTTTLTGSHATSTSIWFYGLSFYTAFFAYHLAQSSLQSGHVWVGSNPLLLFTGPIAAFFTSITHKAWRKRLAYYLPFLVLGIFLFKVVATPLTEFFKLIELTDAVSAVVFALIFELFVYANFCGLSLIIYALLGIFGVKIPLNFRQPFSARNLIEFWKGWHVSLSLVLKALFYNPTKHAMGKSRWGTYAAIMVVFMASAMWHGITVNFIVWGLLHGALFVLTLWLLKLRVRFLLAWVPVLVSIVMLLAIVLGRMIFADSDTERLLTKLSFVYEPNTELWSTIMAVPQAAMAALLIALGLVLVEFTFAKQKQVAKRNYKYLRVPIAQWGLIALFVLLVSANIGIDYAVYGQR